MEPMEAVSEGEWSSLSGIYTFEEADFMAQLLGNGPPDTDPGSGAGSSSRPSHDSTGAGFVGSGNSSFYHSNSTSSPGVIFFSPSGNEDYYLNLNDTTNPVLESGNGSVLIDSDRDFLNPDMAETNVVQLEGEEKEADEKANSSLEISRKRSRSTGNFQKMKVNVKLKKSQSLEFSSRNDEYANADSDKKTSAEVYKQSSRSCGSEDDSSISRGQNGRSRSSTQDPPALNRSGKTRASRGSATDPQSLYARDEIAKCENRKSILQEMLDLCAYGPKRRERINERLKILQSLIPNGTKVDISTMLEEAVHYVKFMQLQIKLLSSDDLWMYAPIAYNGINIGLDLKINTPR